METVAERLRGPDRHAKPERTKRAKPEQKKLPGMPGPSATAIARRLEIEDAIEELYFALSPLLEQLQAGDGARASLSYTYAIKGDKIHITLTGGAGQE